MTDMATRWTLRQKMGTHCISSIYWKGLTASWRIGHCEIRISPEQATQLYHFHRPSPTTRINSGILKYAKQRVEHAHLLPQSVSLHVRTPLLRLRIAIRRLHASPSTLDMVIFLSSAELPLLQPDIAEFSPRFSPYASCAHIK